jgi:hypothetical protein
MLANMTQVSDVAPLVSYMFDRREGVKTRHSVNFLNTAKLSYSEFQKTNFITTGVCYMKEEICKYFIGKSLKINL